ncbi:hypothetical protein F5Y09DRAFT_345598 [Xylaria sp. FL1042]|nr:hypothetical protein F5Y09DRAFT_345598 [Xylaria sp. FL1042]
MESGSHDNMAETNGPDSKHNAIVSNSLTGVGGSNIEQFTLFPHLPPELRLIIWEFAMQETRLVHLRAEDCAIRGE